MNVELGQSGGDLIFLGSDMAKPFAGGNWKTSRIVESRVEEGALAAPKGVPGLKV